MNTPRELKQLVPALLILLCSLSFPTPTTIRSSPVEGEFKVYASGLIYNDTTMKQLSHIVDSLNLKFRICDLHRVYRSPAQALGHHVRLNKVNIREAKKDMDAGMPFEAFMNKYPQARSEKDLLVYRYQYTYYDEKKVVFASLLKTHSIDFDKADYKARPVKGTWVYESREKTSYNEAWIEAFYFLTELQSDPLPGKYARLVQYADCMIDTTAEIYNPIHDDEKDTDRYPAVDKFMNYIHLETNKPEYKENDDSYWQKNKDWDSLRVPLVAGLSKTTQFRQLLKEAVSEALVHGGSSEEFEEYVGEYYSNAAELELKRSRIVVGGCSMDTKPRIHAMHIAVLSAETVKWEIFLRAHLNIMNDRFARVSDGSWAQAHRQTYLRELEELDIQVADLMLGIALRIEDGSENHYRGDIGRMGRALAESSTPDSIESRMLECIQDDSLDHFNRIIFYHLFSNYNYYVADEKRKSANAGKLKQAAEKLPSYLVVNLRKTSED